MVFRIILALGLLSGASCSLATSALFDRNNEFTVFTATESGNSFNAESCQVLDKSTHDNKFNSLFFEHGIVQLSRSLDGSFLNSLVKVVLTKGRLSPTRSVINVVLGENGDDSLLQYRQNLYEDTDTIKVPNRPTTAFHRQKQDASDVRFDINLHLDLFALPPSNVDQPNNDSIALVPGQEYFLEVQLAETPSRSSYDSVGIVECVRVPAVYSGLVSDCTGSSPSSTNDYENCSSNTQSDTYITNEYNLISGTTGGAVSNFSGGFQYDVKLFGAVGDGSADDTVAIQTAIDAAAEVGGSVWIPAGQYFTTASLIVPAGVSLVGDGLGENPRDMSGLMGSIILYRGTEFALVLRGDLIRLDNLVVYDAGIGGGTALGGVLLDGGEGRYLESLRLNSLLIFRFTSGTGLKLYADNGGAVTYCSFYDVRVRNAKVGIHLNATGVGGAFVNSNSFYHGAVSGGGFEYGLLITGPGANNNHNFYGMVIEPYVSGVAHLYLTGATSQINTHHIRIEALQQPVDRPMIYFAPETYGSTLDGLFSAGFVNVNRLAHKLDIATGKFVGHSPSNNNEFSNSGFRALEEESPSEAISATIPGWTFTRSPTAATNEINVTIDNTEQILAAHNVLRLSIAPGTTATLKPTSSPQCTLGSLYRTASFGVYVRHLEEGAVDSSLIYASFDTSLTAVTTSLPHTGTKSWEFVSIAGAVPAVPSGSTAPVSVYPLLTMQNTHATSPLVLEVTLPSFAWGEETPQAESTHIQSSGGVMYGTLTTGMVRSVTPPADGGTYYTLPRDGNVFIFTAGTAYTTLTRLNYSGADRFNAGTVITLLFLSAGVGVSDSAYINLRSGFTSSSHCSLTLLAMDAGTWVELSRDGV